MGENPWLESTDPCPRCGGKLALKGNPHERMICSDCGADYGEVKVHEL